MYRYVVEPAADPVERALRKEDWLRVQMALGRLPEKQRQTLVLFSVEGMSVSDVAEVMGCAVGTVKAQIHKARARLRAELQRQD